MRLVFSDPVWRQLSRLGKPVQKRILKKLEFWLAEEEPLRFAEALVDPAFGQWRFRVGEMIREYLETLAGADDPERSIAEFKSLSGRGHSRGWRFNRHEIHERP